MAGVTTISALVLAGGAGRRVGHRDKGLIIWRGKPLIAHVCDSLQPQVEEILISCNRNVASYRSFATRTVTDSRDSYQGPLAGLEAASDIVRSQLLVVVCCDTPLLPHDLVSRLVTPLSKPCEDAPEISYAHDGERAQYLCAAMRTTCLTSLPDFLNNGHRAVREWYRSRHAVAVDFSDHYACFKNFNNLK